MTATITCTSVDCPERKSLCCGSISRKSEVVETMLGVPLFTCKKCGKAWEGGKCDAKKFGYWDEDGKFYNCMDGEKHPSWWIAIATTPEWQAWYQYASENHLYDVDECVEAGWMSNEHARDFMKFVQETYKKVE